MAIYDLWLFINYAFTTRIGKSFKLPLNKLRVCVLFWALLNQGMN
ncbi:hypothetical protein RintRC_2701 [Richelia intracellularis]|nr:hypothetical protein RintRC_2701 [Richelia intracellularis]